MTYDRSVDIYNKCILKSRKRIKKIISLYYYINDNIIYNVNKKFDIQSRKSRYIFINSNANYYRKTTPILIGQLRSMKFNLDKIIVFVGGCDEDSDDFFGGVRHVFTRNNTFDLTCIVAMLDFKIEVPYFFLLHDTVSIENYCFKQFIDYYPLRKKSTVSIADFPSMNIGFYSSSVVRKCSNEIMNMANYSKNHNILQEVKRQCIVKEDLLFKINRYHKFAFGFGVRPVSELVTYMDKVRLRESYDKIGLLKYKANYYIKSEYIIDL